MTDNSPINEFELEKLDLIILQENLHRIRTEATTTIPPTVTGTLGVIFTVAALLAAEMIGFMEFVYGLGFAGSILGSMVYYNVIYIKKKYKAALCELASKINSMKVKYSCGSHNSLPERTTEIHRSKLESAANLATILGTVAALVLLGIAVEGIRSSENLLDQTTRSAENLNQLIDKSNQQLQALNSTVTQISHQTIMQAYLNGKPFKVDVKSCWYNEQNRTITYQPQIVDEEGNLSPLKFMLITSFGYYTNTDEHESPQLGDVGTLSPSDTLMIEPGRQQSFQRSLSALLNETIGTSDSYLFVRSQYSFAPYSDATDSILTDYVEDKIGHQVIAFKKPESGREWEQLTSNNNSVCK